MTDLDILIRNTTIVDGTGRPSFQGSLGIQGERIVSLGDEAVPARRVIDGAGLVTCPGFVDPHTHVDFTMQQYPLAENLVMQGITTCVGGNCGLSLAPVVDTEVASVVLDEVDTTTLAWDWRTLDEWLRRVEVGGLSINYVPLVGHSLVRAMAMGQEWARAASPSEIDRMKRLVSQAMSEGAFGLSAGLDMPWAGYYARAEELVELVQVTHEYGGLFAPHTRHLRNLWPTDDPAERLYSVYYGPKGEVLAGRYHGLLEAVEICKHANNARLHIAHLPLAYVIPQPHPEFLDDALAQATLAQVIDRARDEGLDVTYNVIAAPNTIAGEMPILDLFFRPAGPPPPWLAELKELGRGAFVDQLKNRRFREKLKAVVASGRFKFGMVHPATDPYWMDRYTILHCRQAEYQGKTVGEIARAGRRCTIAELVYDRPLETVFELLIENPDTTWTLSLDNRGTPRTHGILLSHPAGMPCTDTTAYPASVQGGSAAEGHGVSPSAFGLYPGYLKTYVKDHKVLSLEEAIRKATYVPAQAVFGLGDRGIIRQGAYADLVMFDYERISDARDPRVPTRPPAGIAWVLVNGCVVYENGNHSGAKPGRVLRRS